MIMKYLNPSAPRLQRLGDNDNRNPTYHNPRCAIAGNDCLDLLMKYEIETNRRGWTRAIISKPVFGIVTITPWRKDEIETIQDIKKATDK